MGEQVGWSQRSACPGAGPSRGLLWTKPRRPHSVLPKALDLRAPSARGPVASRWEVAVTDQACPPKALRWIRRGRGPLPLSPPDSWRPAHVLPNHSADSGRAWMSHPASAGDPGHPPCVTGPVLSLSMGGEGLGWHGCLSQAGLREGPRARPPLTRCCTCPAPHPGRCAPSHTPWPGASHAGEDVALSETSGGKKP